MRSPTEPLKGWSQVNGLYGRTHTIHMQVADVIRSRELYGISPFLFFPLDSYSSCKTNGHAIIIRLCQEDSKGSECIYYRDIWCMKSAACWTETIWHEYGFQNQKPLCGMVKWKHNFEIKLKWWMNQKSGNSHPYKQISQHLLWLHGDHIFVCFVGMPESY